MGRHDVQGKTHEAKTFRHGAVGEVALSYQAFDVRDAPGQQLIVYGRSRTAAAPRRCGCWAHPGRQSLAPLTWVVRRFRAIRRAR
ncbi:hypothetical protein Jiend_51020 [Micromonospora endophytica]|nr:hypothetical protein [Micromonospora endophytica]BCJ61680.1 hypothetical protein Jiend_51020 [Micromonospora endophytica]